MVGAVQVVNSQAEDSSLSVSLPVTNFQSITFTFFGHHHDDVDDDHDQYRSLIQRLPYLPMLIGIAILPSSIAFPSLWCVCPTTMNN